MTRSITDPAAANRGSRKWLQILVNCRPELLNDSIAQRLHELPDDIDWRSPIWEDHYAEYRDQSFLDRLAGSMYYRAPMQAQQELSDFWPRFGPQWDGLAVSDRGQVLLVEAKAHIPEMVTAPTQARGESALLKIQESLGRVKNFVNSKAPVDWSTSFYQYANRLAHLTGCGATRHDATGQPALITPPAPRRMAGRHTAAGSVPGCSAKFADWLRH